MPYSYVLLPGDGTTTNFNFNFGYLARAHIHVSVDTVDTPFTFLTDFSVQITPAPASGSVIEIRRITPLNEPIVDWTDGTVLTETDMDLNTLFSLFAAQEAQDGVDASITQNAEGVWDGQGRSTTNFTAPTDNTGLVTKGYFDDVYAPQIEAQVQEATTQATNAASSASTAQGYAIAADSSADLAAALLATFKGQYLGSLSSDPTVDGNGNPVSTGDLYFNSTDFVMKVYTGLAWVNAGSTVEGTINKPVAPIIATEGQTSVVVPGGYDPNFILVYVNGILVSQPDIDVTSGSTIEFSPALVAGDEVTWVAFGAFSADATVAQVRALLADTTDPNNGAAMVGYRSGITVEDKLSETTSVEDYGAVGDGVTDDSAAILSAITNANGRLVFGRNKTYLLNSSLGVNSPIHIDLNGSQLNFVYDSTLQNEAGFKVQSDDVTIENGSIDMNGAVVGAASSALVPIYGGRENTGEGWDRLTFKNLELSTNGTGGIVFMGDNRNVLVEHIHIKDSASIRIGIAFEWGGTPELGTGHPHNIKIRNITAGKFTFPGDPSVNYTCLVWLSSAFNVEVENIYAEEVPTLVNVFTGDKSNLYAPDSYRRLVGTNISIENAACDSITGYGIRVYGLGTDSPIPLPQSVRIRGLNIKDNFAGIYITMGVLLEYCSNVVLEDFIIDGFVYGVITGADVIQPSIGSGIIRNCGQKGLQFGALGFTTISPRLRDVQFYSNNTHLTSGTETASAVVLTDTRDPIVEGCTFGRAGVAETQKYSIVCTSATVRPKLNNNHTYAIASGGVSYVIDTSSSTGINASGINNTSLAGIANVGGAPIFQISSNGDRTFASSALPTVGSYAQGDKVYFSDPIAAGFIGAVCVAAGSPGTWKNFGAIVA